THIGDVVFDYQDLFDKFDIPNTGFLPFGVEGVTPYGTGLLVTYFNFIGNPVGNFFVPGV
ncbi:MAG TPA: hypothetical protein VNJ31_01310, partial [Methyloceanibacter sp.]|nr:hypothetical protein [Methyloceanibacter sp.]